MVWRRIFQRVVYCLTISHFFALVPLWLEFQFRYFNIIVFCQVRNFVYFCKVFYATPTDKEEMKYRKYINCFVLLLTLLAAPTVTTAQNKETQRDNKTEIKINKLDVIYEDEEYKGMVIDRRNSQETERYMYQAPIFVVPEDEDYDDFEEEGPNIFTLDDEGVESEDDILLEGFDTAIIHQPKFNVNSIIEPIVVKLRDPSSGQKFTWPTPWSARPSSHYGPRRRRFHYGLDLAQPTGEPIYAAFDGVVRISKYNRSYGNLVIIHHPNGLETYYAHMSKRKVHAGDQVRSGDVIGLCGNTGRSFGSHLHFEIRYKGNAINPENVMNCSTHDLISDELSLTPNSFRKTATRNKVSGNAGSSTGGWYRVRQGDTLEKIARRNGTTITQLCRLNGISENKVLHPGDRLRVSGNPPAPYTKSKADANKGSTTYRVRQGDSLYKIANAHGTTIQELCRLNGLSETSTLQVGQKLIVK